MLQLSALSQRSQPLVSSNLTIKLMSVEVLTCHPFGVLRDTSSARWVVFSRTGLILIYFKFHVTYGAL